MKKKFLVCLLLMCVSSLFAEEITFKKLHWGMSKWDVERAESPNNASKLNDTLVYEGKIKGAKTILIHKFEYNQLLTTLYTLDDRRLNKSKFIKKTYSRWCSMLKKEYGKGTESSFDKIVKFYKTIWILENKKIQIACSIDPNVLQIEINYIKPSKKE